MDITVRFARAGDRNNWLVLWFDYLSKAGLTSDDNNGINTWQRIMDMNSSIICWVAEVDNHIAGFAVAVVQDCVLENDPICCIEHIYVMEELRGKGLGKALIQAIKLERDFAGWSKIYWLSASLTRHQTFLVN